MKRLPRYCTPVALRIVAAPIAPASTLPPVLNASKRADGPILKLEADPTDVPILIGGKWNGHPLDLASMEEMVATYNPAAQPAPIKLTHAEVADEAKKKAYGWVKALRIGDWTPPGFSHPVKTLFAKLAFTEEGRQAVASGAYRMKSLEAWPRNHTSNPTTGKWNFRALALLGAESPGCPNLSPLTLAAGDEEPETPVLILQADATPTPGGQEPPQKGDPMDPKELAALQAKATENAALTTQVASLTAQLAAQTKAAEETAVQTRLDGLVKDAKLTPAQALIAKPVLLSVPTEGVVTLAEGKNVTPREALFSLLEGLSGHGLLKPGEVPHSGPAKLDAEDKKAFDAAVQKHVDAGKPYDQAVELAARELDTPNA